MQERIDEVNRLLREQITGIRVVRAFVREPHETRAVRRRQRRAHRRRAARRPLAGHDVPDRDARSLNVSSVAVLWFGGHRVDERPDGGRRADRVPLLPDADPDVGDDGDLHADDGPARRRSAPTGSSRCSTPTRSVVPPAEPVTAVRRAAARSSFEDVDVHLPGRRRSRCCATSRSRARPGQTVAIIGSTGAGKSHPGQPRAAALRRHRRPGAGRRRRRPRPRPRRALVADRAGAAAGRTCSPAPSPPTCATASPTRPTTRCGRRSRSPRPRDFVEAMPDGLDAADRPGRHQRLRRPAAAARDRAGADPAAARSTCSTTRSRRSTSPPTPGCGRRCGRSPRDATVRASSPSGSPRSATPT